MQIFIRSAFAVLLMFARPLFAQALPSPSQLFERIAPSVMVLEVFDKRGTLLGAHTATLIGPQRLLTSCRAIAAATSLELVSGTKRRAAHVVSRDLERNLCALAAEGITEPPLEIALLTPPTGTRIYTLTNAEPFGITISEGVISDTRQSLIRFSAPVSVGSEGGALIDTQGRLLGIVDQRRRDGQNVNFAAPAIWFSDLDRRSETSRVSLKRLDDAMTDLREGRWESLAERTQEWTREQPENEDAWLLAAYAHGALNNAAEELHARETLYRLNTGNADSGTALGTLLLKQGKLADARALATKLASEHRQSASVQFLLAQTYHLTGQFKEAEIAYQRTIQLDEWSFDAYRGLAALAQARGDHRTAIDLWTRLSAFSGGTPDALPAGLIQAYLLAGAPERAWMLLGQFEDTAARGLLWYWRGVVLSSMQRPTQALAAFRQALAENLSHPALAWQSIGLVLSDLKRHPEAVDAFQNAADLDPDSTESRYLLTIALKDSGRADEALPIIRTLTETHPNEAKFWRQLGMVLTLLGQANQAIPVIEKSLQMDPKQAKLWTVLAQALYQTGQPAEALHAAERARALDSSSGDGIYIAIAASNSGARP